jgi:hypothetical protein
MANTKPIQLPKGHYNCPTCGYLPLPSDSIRKEGMYYDPDKNSYHWKEVVDCKKCHTLFSFKNSDQ